MLRRWGGWIDGVANARRVVEARWCVVVSAQATLGGPLRYRATEGDASMRAATLSPEHHDALSILLACLDDAKVWYRISGGLAGIIHGSKWPLHDIDVDVCAAEWPRVLAALAEFIDTLPRHYEDDEFRLVLANATIEGISVDISQLEDAYGRQDGRWVPLPADPSRRELHAWSDFAIWAIPLEDLIAYKTLIGRTADLRELRRLQ